jgi:hypothetical protein
MKTKEDISPHLKAFIAHCQEYASDRNPGLWFLSEVYKDDSDRIEKAYKKCLTTLRQLNKEEIDKDCEFILIDRTYELNYRILACYLNQKAKKYVLEYLQRINFYVQGIICRDVKNLEAHYQRNKGL